MRDLPDLSEIFRRTPYISTSDNLRSTGGENPIIVESPGSPRVQRSSQIQELGPAPESHNWKPKRADSTHLTISPGYVLGAPATIGGTSLGDPTPPQLTVSASDFTYVYLCVNWSLYIYSGHVGGGSITSRVITAETSTQTNTSTARYFLLFTWQSGKLVAQSRFWNFDMDVYDDGSATSTPVYRTWVSP